MTPEEQKGGQEFNDLQVAFDNAFIAAGAPKGAFMCASNLGTQDQYFYFSPIAAKLFSTVLTARGARPCGTPLRSAVSVLVANGDASEALL